MVLCIPTHSHFNPDPVSPSVFHTLHTDLLLALPVFTSPSPSIRLCLSSHHLHHYYCCLVQQWCSFFLDVCCRPGFPAGVLTLLVFLLVNWSSLQRNPEMCRCGACTVVGLSCSLWWAGRTFLHLSQQLSPALCEGVSKWNWGPVVPPELTRAPPQTAWAEEQPAGTFVITHKAINPWQQSQRFTIPAFFGNNEKHFCCQSFK